MGSYLSKTTDGETAHTAATPGTHQQRVTFADPPETDARPAQVCRCIHPASADAADTVLKRGPGRPRGNRLPTAVITLAPSSASKSMAAGSTPKGKRAPRRKAVTPSPAPAAESPAATPAAAPTPTPKRRGRPAGSGKKTKAARTTAAASPAAAAASPELVVVGTAVQAQDQSVVKPAKRKRSALPAQKVNMKRVAKRALKPVAQKGGRGRRA